MDVWDLGVVVARGVASRTDSDIAEEKKEDDGEAGAAERDEREAGQLTGWWQRSAHDAGRPTADGNTDSGTSVTRQNHAPTQI